MRATRDRADGRAGRGIDVVARRSPAHEITELRARGVGVLLVEQKVDAVLRVADRVALIENGRIVGHATPSELAAEPEVLLRHVGVRR
jgi:ABC-type branched-subunit amino acid transport system ATPase component